MNIIAASALLVLASALALVLALHARRHRKMREDIRSLQEQIDELQQEAVELRDATRRSESASAAKSELLANVSHEMRTPLHGILGMLQLATDSEPSVERRLQLQMAASSARSLLATIEDILDFTRAEARKLELEPVYFSVRELVTDTMKTLAVTAAEKGLRTAFLIEPNVPDRLWGDPLRVRQILINLVGNAVKFTERGEVVVRGRAVPVLGADIMLQFDVRDTGPGIDPQLKDSVFDPFSRGDSPPSPYGGSGLGLSIVARLVQAMGGTIDFESEPGKGTTFHVAVKLTHDAIAGVTAPQWESSLSGLRVLVVEPHPTMRAILAEILGGHGIAAEAYGSVGDALQPSIREAFSCVVIDAAELASTPWIPPVPVVQIVPPASTLILPTVTVSRPVGERELLEGIAVALGIIDRRMSFTLERRVESDRPESVLVVDDHPVNLEFAAEALRRLGHAVATASSGEEALRMLQVRTFDVALVDVEMPETDGYEVTRRLRSMERRHRTRVIALTGHADPEERERCIAAGMDGVLTKPLTQNRLAAVLRGQASDADGDSILEAVGGNVKLLIRVRDAFASQSPRLLDSIRDAIAQRNSDTLCRSAHTLKGAISNFGVGEALEVAIRLERAGKEGDFEHAAVLLPRLESAVRDLQERMSAALAASQTAAQG